RVADLVTDAGELVELAVGLPTVDEPELDLEAIGQEELQPSAVEEPRRVVGGERRLIAPVFVLRVGEEADVREEEADVEVDAAQLVPVVDGVRFGQVAHRRQEIVLAVVRREVVARNADGALAELKEDAAAHRADVRVAADAEEGELE